MEENVNNIRKTGALAIISLILGIISFISSWTIVIGILFGIISIILGLIAIIKKQKLTCSILGIIFSIIGIFFSVTMILLMPKLGSYLKELNNELVTIDRNNAGDLVSGYSFIEKTDDSLLELKANGTFKYYKDKDDLTDYYYEGIYKVYYGKELLDFASNSSNFTSSQKAILKNEDSETLNKYYFLILNNEKCIIKGKNTMTTPNYTYYFGTYDKNTNILSVVNMRSANIYNFVKN